MDYWRSGTLIFGAETFKKVKGWLYWIIGGAVLGAALYFYFFRSTDKRPEYLEKARAAKAAKKEAETMEAINEREGNGDTEKG